MSQQAHIDELFVGLWDDFVGITPSAKKVHALIAAHDTAPSIVNDHIALRTLALPGMGIMSMAQHFINLGYTHGGDYDFSSKKLNAMHFEHSDSTNPKVFISELNVDELSPTTQQILTELSHQIPAGLSDDARSLYSGTHWKIRYDQYQTLLEESEYAAWFAAWGFRANHFTVSVNHLQRITELAELNALLKAHDFTLNTSGGEIKGGKDVCLAQSSTMADRMPVAFADKTVAIPSCFYEFAQRYPLADGTLYQGFVAASADKIFESTNAS